MALTPYINTTEIIRALDDEPNDVGGLSADQLKAKFDLFADEFKEFFNETHIGEVEAEIQAFAGTVWSLPTTDKAYVGTVSEETIAEDGAIGDVLYLTSIGYSKAQAADDTKLPCVGLRLETGTGSKKILRYGMIKNTSWSFTKGQLLWLSTSTAGAITNTKPTTTGNRVQCIGHAVATDTIFFNPSDMWIEVA